MSNTFNTDTGLDWVLRQDSEFKYRLLSRMKSDCEYYLGYGNRCSKHLWAGNEVDHINYMKSIWNNLVSSGNPKPDWLSFEQILDYGEKFGLEKSEVYTIVCTDHSWSLYGRQFGGKFPSYNDALSWASDNIPKDIEFEIQNDVEYKVVHPAQQTQPHPICRDSDIVPTDPTVWICVYKDTLGFPDDHDNLTDICVPTDWLLNILKAEGENPESWFSEYTADSTDDIARRAKRDGVIFGCADKTIEDKVIAKDGALSCMISSADLRASSSSGNEKPAVKELFDI